jgi:hypothetical protein
MKYRKKPLVVEAEQFVSAIQPIGRHATVPTSTMFLEYPVMVDDAGAFLAIPTLEGTIRANNGDWIITGVKGERYPCKPEIFAATYEPLRREHAQCLWVFA